jgi:hypothetical protein
MSTNFMHVKVSDTYLSIISTLADYRLMIIQQKKKGKDQNLTTN